jgi:hypothetical protein
VNFEEQLLMDLKAEFAARAERRRRVGRRLFAGAAVAGSAATAAIAVPLLTGSEPPAYAVTKNSNGTIRVQINEFRDSDKLERDLGAMGVPADVTYLKPGKWCKPDRGAVVAGSDKVARMRKGGMDIDPKHIGKNQTLLLQLAESDGPASGPAKPQVLWQARASVIQGKVKPCVVVDDPGANDLGGPEGQPPAGS